MSLLSRFQQYIQQHHLFQSKDQLLLAVSGGVDSIVLVDLCHKADYQFTIAHCNFQLRGEESDADETFVRSIEEKYNVEVLVKKFDTEEYAATNKLSIQEAARALRYSWFEELISRQTPSSDELVERASLPRPTGVSDELVERASLPRPTGASDGVIIHLLTAHHADDNIETLLMNFFRGTGLHGLTGIPVSNGYIKRPLLSFTKQELLDYATKQGLQFREDSSNQSSKYTRNFFRNEIIPAIEYVYPQVKTNLTDNINRFLEIEQLYKLSTQALIKKLCRTKGNEIHIPVKQLLEFKNKALIYEIIHPYGFSEKQMDEVLKLAESESGKYIDSPAFHYRIIKHRHWFIISPVLSVESATIIIEEKDVEVLFEEGRLSCAKTDASKVELTSTNNIALLDAKRITFPLLLRKWKTGDYFYPLGMKNLPAGRQGKKKVARFLIDNKLSKTQKEKVWVLESNKKIIWVVGHRIDDRFKITPATTDLLQIKFTATER